MPQVTWPCGSPDAHSARLTTMITKSARRVIPGGGSGRGEPRCLSCPLHRDPLAR
jgi:hypothetical protein